MGKFNVKGDKEGGGITYAGNLEEWERNMVDKRNRDKCTKVVREGKNNSQGSVLVQGERGRKRENHVSEDKRKGTGKEYRLQRVNV